MEGKASRLCSLGNRYCRRPRTIDLFNPIVDRGSSRSSHRFPVIPPNCKPFFRWQCWGYRSRNPCRIWRAPWGTAPTPPPTRDAQYHLGAAQFVSIA